MSEFFIFVPAVAPNPKEQFTDSGMHTLAALMTIESAIARDLGGFHKWEAVSAWRDGLQVFNGEVTVYQIFTETTMTYMVRRIASLAAKLFEQEYVLTYSNGIEWLINKEGEARLLYEGVFALST